MSETTYEVTEEVDEREESSASRWILPGILAALLAVAVAVAAWLWWDNRTPSSGSADAGFARDMSAHHAQAVEMAMIAYQRTEDSDIRQIAYDIATSQQAQIGMMTGWLNIWDLSTAREGEPMEWAGDQDMAGMDMTGEELDPSMPGLLTQEAIDQLRTLEPAEMDLEFLRLMTIHHQGGIAMAEAALDEAEEDVVKTLANSIIVSQTAEITNMQNMLAEREAA